MSVAPEPILGVLLLGASDGVRQADSKESRNPLMEPSRSRR